jgi:hypothetical protein
MSGDENLHHDHIELNVSAESGTEMHRRQSGLEWILEIDLAREFGNGAVVRQRRGGRL